MTKRDDYYKALGRVGILTGVTKNLGSISVIAADPDMMKLATNAQTAISSIYERLSELAQQEKDPEPAVLPTAKAILMPAANSKEEFALAAMAEAMGLTVTDVIVAAKEAAKVPNAVTDAKIEAIINETKADKLTKTDVEHAVLKEFGSIKDVVEKAKKETVTVSLPHLQPEPPVEPKETTTFTPAKPKFDPKKYKLEWDAEARDWVIISLATGMPKRPYVRTGNFSAKAIAERGGKFRTPEQHREYIERRKELKKGYSARRMS